MSAKKQRARQRFRVAKGPTQAPTDKQMLSLHRYFIWTGHMRFQFSERLRASKTEQERWHAHFVEPYLPYWCAGMYTLVDGWKQLGLADADIDQLLDTEHLALLERFRHGVYHFHPEYYDEKFRGFWAQGREINEWLDRLWIAFDSFFRSRFRRRFPAVPDSSADR